MAEWVQHALWWQVYPLGFLGCPTQAQDNQPIAHRLPALTNWLDYLVELGANGLALGPIFASESHGYDTIDHRRIDPRLGTEDDFLALVAAAKQRGIRVLLDGVFNHVGRGHPAFQDVLRHGPSSAYADWFRLFWPSHWQPGTEPDYAHFEGHRRLVDLNHDNPKVVDEIADVMTYWLDRGVDGWRLDAAYAVPPSFWAAVLPRVRARHPQAFFVGEVIHGDYAQIVRDSGLDSLTQYELWKSSWSSINDANFFELAWTLTRHNELLKTFPPLTFVGNHDVTRIASQLRDPRHLAHALVVLLTVGGIPSIYYGDEQGLTGVKEERFGGDDEIRPAFPDSPDSPDQRAPGGPNAAVTLRRETLTLHRELIGLRRRNPWLHRAQTTQLHLTNEQFCYETRAEGQRLVVALNLADTPAALPAITCGAVLAGRLDRRPNGRLSLPAHGWAVLAG